MNKKGFTVVEILAVVLLISVVGVICYPMITKTLGIGKNKIQEINLNQVKDAAKTMITEITFCDLSDDLKNALGMNSCKDIKNKMYSAQGLKVTIEKMEDNNFLETPITKCNKEEHVECSRHCRSCTRCSFFILSFCRTIHCR